VRLEPQWGVFAPEPCQVLPTIAESPHLRIKERSIKWCEAQASWQQSQAEREAAKAQEARAKDEREKSAWKAYREAHAFKAAPVPDFSAPFVPNLSRDPVTHPKLHFTRGED
jgi:Targeting protein for Xklp2 (TPX2) domain